MVLSIPKLNEFLKYYPEFEPYESSIAQTFESEISKNYYLSQAIFSFAVIFLGWYLVEKGYIPPIRDLYLGVLIPIGLLYFIGFFHSRYAMYRTAKKLKIQLRRAPEE